MKLTKKLLIYLGISLAIAPKIEALDGIVLDPTVGVSDALVELYHGDDRIDFAVTDENGFYEINPTSVTLPKPNYTNNPIEQASIYDIMGRTIKKLDKNQLRVRQQNLPAGTYILKGDNDRIVSFTTLDGDIPFNPLQRLEERLERESSKTGTSSIDDDETYTLVVSDDWGEEGIGDYYDMSFDLGPDRDNVLSLKQDAQLIPYYDMEDWDGDFLEYLVGTHDTATFIWGDYPNNYPINVDIDSVSCVEYCGDGAEEILSDVRYALDLWNERTGLDLFNYTNITEDNRQVLVNYDPSESPHFEYDYERDQDGRYRFSSGIVYLDADLLGGNIGREIIKHEFGHATGWGNHSRNRLSIMYPSAGEDITEDDGKVVRTFTLLKNNTYWAKYSQE